MRAHRATKRNGVKYPSAKLPLAPRRRLLVNWPEWRDFEARLARLELRIARALAQIKARKLACL